MDKTSQKKRGRKKNMDKITTDNLNITEESNKMPMEKKRGRKKKFETSNFKTNFVFIDKKEEDVTEDNSEFYNTFDFGKLSIKVKDKNTDELNRTINNIIIDTCEINFDKDDKLIPKCKNNISKSLYVNLDKIKNENVRCFHCHYTFKHKPFFLPIEYCVKKNGYKLFGNFCSPNCVKAYCYYNKNFENKLYLVGDFYRKIFGYGFRIKPAPSNLKLKDYGGDLTIEEFRDSFYKNENYTLLPIFAKIVYLN